MSDYITKKKRNINNFNDYSKSYDEKEDNIQNKIKIKKQKFKIKKELDKPIEGNNFIKEEDEIKKYKYSNIKFKNSFRFKRYVKLNYKSC